MTRTQNDSAAGYGAERNGLSPGLIADLRRVKQTSIRTDKYRFRNPEGPEAADVIEDLSARLRAAEGALRPFAYYYDLNDLDDRAADDTIDVPVGDLRAAKAALPHPAGEGNL